MSSSESQVISLLCSRERELMKVWECEEAIRGLLGVADFPFPAVPDLPSRRKVKRGATRRVPKRDAEPVVSSSSLSVGDVPEIRGLLPGESAYRLEFESRGRRESSFHTDLDSVLKLFQVPSDDFQMHRVETVAFRSVDDWDLIKVLWERRRKD